MGCESVKILIARALFIFVSQPPLVDVTETLFWTVQISQVSGEGNMTIVNTASADITSVTVSGLKKGTNYQVRVASNSQRGLGEFTAYFERQTLVDGEY